MQSGQAPGMLCIASVRCARNLRAFECQQGLGGVWGGKPPATFVVSPSRNKMEGICYGTVVWKGKGSWLFYVVIFISLSSFSLFPQDDTVLLSNLRVGRKETSFTKCAET